MAYQLDRFDDKTPSLADTMATGDRLVTKEDGKLIATQLMADISELQALMMGAGQWQRRCGAVCGQPR